MNEKDFEKAKKLAVELKIFKESLIFVVDGSLIIFAISRYLDSIFWIICLNLFLFLKVYRLMTLDIRQIVENNAKIEKEKEAKNEISDNNC